MKDGDKSKQQLVAELDELRQKIAQFEGEGDHGTEYRMVFENTGTAMLVIEQDMTISRVNHQFELLCGYSREEIEGKKKWTEFIVPQDLERMKRLHIERRQPGAETVTQYEFRFLDRKGNMRDIFLTVNMIPGTKQSVVSLIDITERKRAEEYVQHLNQELHSIRKINQLIVWERDRDKLLQGLHRILMETRGYSHVWIVLLDDAGRVTTWTQAGLDKEFRSLAEKLRRGELPACIQKALGQQDVVVVEDPRSVCRDCPLSESYAGMGALIVRLEARRKVYGVLSVSCPPQFIAEAREIELLQEVARDIAFALHNIEREQQAEVRRAQLASIFRYSPFAMIIVDENNCILEANSRFEEVFGYTSNETLGKNIDDLIVPQRFKGKEAHELDVRAQRGVLGYETIRKRKDGQEIHVSLSAGPVKVAGEVVGIFVIFQDITERKQAEQALAESEERYRSIVDATADAVLTMDERGEISSWNKGAENMFGYTAEEAIGQEFNLLIVPQRYRKGVSRGMARFSATGEGPILGHPVEVSGLRKDGSEFPLEMVISPFKSGGVWRAMGTVRDITVRKQEEEVFRSVVQGLQVGVYVVQDGKFVLVNPKFEQLTGYSEAELKGMSPLSLVHPDYRDEVRRNAIAMLKGQRTTHYEFRGKPREGTKWLVEGVATIQYRGKRATLGSYIDVTEQRRAEEGGRKAEEKYRRLFETSRDSVFITTPGGQWLDANRAAVELFGYDSREGLMAVPVWERYVHREEREKFLQVMEQQGYVVGFPATMKKRDGTVIDVLTTAVAVRDEGGEVVFQGTIRDITELKRAEAERRNLEQQAMRASQLASVGEMASGIAHEINNPLTGVIGFSQLLMQEELPEDIRGQVETIHEGAQRVAGIIKGLLTFARQHKPERTYADINHLIETTLALRTYSLRMGNIEVVRNFDPGLPLTMADAGQLQQVFMNLVANAESEMRRAHGRGKLVVTTGKTDDRIRISFADDGPGIPREDLVKIFQPHHPPPVSCHH